jgi:UDP-N-acetylmuramate dehydrogenase
MTLANKFPEITRVREPLASHTYLRIGGPAEFFVQPRSVDELKNVLKFCKSHGIPLRMLGGGHNLLVRDDPVSGAVIRLAQPEFTWIERSDRVVRAAGGGQLFDLIAHTVKAGLAGLETLVGIRGTVGGSVRVNVGDRTGEIGSAVRRVAVMMDTGAEHIRDKDDLSFGDHTSDLDEPVVLWVEFELDAETPEAVLRRMRKAWIIRKQSEPLSFQPAVRMFRDPAGQTASELIDQARLAKVRVGGAEVSDRNGNYAVAHPGTTARDVLRLVDMVQERVREVTGVELERELRVW